MVLFLLVIADLPVSKKRQRNVANGCKSSARRVLSDIHELRTLDANKKYFIFWRGYFRVAQVASALISSADRDTFVSLSLVVEPTFRGFSSQLVIIIKTPQNVRFLLWRQREKYFIFSAGLLSRCSSCICAHQQC